MKKMIFSGIFLFSIVIIIMAFNFPAGNTKSNHVNPQQEVTPPAFPENVAKVLETSCFDCHSNTSSNEKALDKINFSKWNDLKKGQKVGKMQDIIDMVKKGEMPPPKYLAKYPDRKPGQEDKDIIIKWATEESDKLLGN